MATACSVKQQRTSDIAHCMHVMTYYNPKGRTITLRCSFPGGETQQINNYSDQRIQSLAADRRYFPGLISGNVLATLCIRFFYACF